MDDLTSKMVFGTTFKIVIGSPYLLPMELSKFAAGLPFLVSFFADLLLPNLKSLKSTVFLFFDFLDSLALLDGSCEMADFVLLDLSLSLRIVSGWFWTFRVCKKCAGFSWKLFKSE